MSFSVAVRFSASVFDYFLSLVRQLFFADFSLEGLFTCLKLRWEDAKEQGYIIGKLF